MGRHVGMEGMMGGKGKEIDRAAAEVGNKMAPRSRPNSAGVGNERKADVRGAQGGQPTDGTDLHGAVCHLGEQHPQRYDDLGPHHGGKK
jgi:hypothetical protein